MAKQNNIRILTDESTGKRYAYVDGKLVPVADKPATVPSAGTKAKAATGKGKAAPATVEFVLTGKTVAATGYLPNAVYTWNKAKAEEMGATVSVVDKHFAAAFTTVKKAEAFSKVATYTIPAEDYDTIVADRTARAEAYKVAHPKRDNKAIAAVMRENGAQPVGELWERAKAAYDANGLDGVRTMFAPAKGKGKGKGRK